MPTINDWGPKDETIVRSQDGGLKLVEAPQGLVPWSSGERKSPIIQALDDLATWSRAHRKAYSKARRARRMRLRKLRGWH